MKMPERSMLELGQDAVVTIANGDSSVRNKGDRVQLVAPTYIESPGHASLLVVPSTEQPANIVVGLKPLIPQNGPRNLSSQGAIDLNKFLLETGEIQDLFEARRYPEALGRLEQLIPTYPSATQLSVWRAVLLKTLARPIEAMNVIDGVLKVDPGNAQAKHLFEQWSQEYVR